VDDPAVARTDGRRLGPAASLGVLGLLAGLAVGWLVWRSAPGDMGGGSAEALPGPGTGTVVEGVSIAHDPVLGPEGAPVTIVEFSDFQCPACRSFNPILDQILDAYGDSVRVAFRQYPLRAIHPQAQPAAEASLCARDQGKFWELHDAMFANQKGLAPAQLKELARELELDGEVFDQCLDGGTYRAIVDQDLARGESAGVSGTPSVFINGREVAPGQVPSFEQMKALIDDELRRMPTR
jgi:protein-disulfide isomerase